MDATNDFTLFQLLSVDIRLMIWEFSFIPRVFSLRPERYENPVDLMAISKSVIGGYHSQNGDQNGKQWTGRFVPSDIPSHAVFQVSKEPRCLAFSQGYRTWTMQQRGGTTRNMIWCPSKDIILFPESSRHQQRNQIPSFNWLRMFAAQYQHEITIAENIALHTSIWHRDHLESNWISGQLFKFLSLRNLILVIDYNYERALVQDLHERSIPRRWGPWKLPNSIVEALENARLKHPERILQVPSVRIIGDPEEIVGTSHLEITLRCNPCHFLEQREESSVPHQLIAATE